jgi:hypothetical protein
MAGLYTKLVKVTFRNGVVKDFGAAGSNGIIDAEWVYVQSGTNSLAFPRESILNIEVGATVAHIDTAISSGDALFT